MAKKVTGDWYYDLDGQLTKIKRQLRQSSGYPFDPENLKKHLQDAIEGKFTKAGKTTNNILTLISGGHDLVLDECDGSETLAEAKDVFAFIDLDLKRWGLNRKGTATPKTSVRVYEMAEDALFAKMFNSLSSDLRKLCFTQAQIKGFARKYRDWLRTDGYGTFFLFEENYEFFVADVDVYSGGRLLVHVHRLEHSSVWDAEYRPRVVAPQLA